MGSSRDNKNMRRHGDWEHAPCRICGTTIGACSPSHTFNDFVLHDRKHELPERHLARFDIYATKEGYQLREDDVSSTTFKDSRFDRHHRLIDLWLFIGYKLGIIKIDPRYTYTRCHEDTWWDRDIYQPPACEVCGEPSTDEIVRDSHTQADGYICGRGSHWFCAKHMREPIMTYERKNA